MNRSKTWALAGCVRHTPRSNAACASCNWHMLRSVRHTPMKPKMQGHRMTQATTGSTASIPVTSRSQASAKKWKDSRTASQSFMQSIYRIFRSLCISIKTFGLMQEIAMLVMPTFFKAGIPWLDSQRIDGGSWIDHHVCHLPNAIHLADVVWYVLIWFDMFWYVLMWFDMVWYVLRWFDICGYLLICFDLILYFWQTLICLDKCWNV